MKVHVWNEAVCFLFTTYLSCLGRGLDVRDAVGAGELLGLPCVHCACREVTFVSHKHHGNVVRVLHTFDLFSANWGKKKKNATVDILFAKLHRFLSPPQLRV